MRGTCTTAEDQNRSVSAPGTAPGPRRRGIREMNNAENFASVEVKRKIAREEARWDGMEKGEAVVGLDVKRDGVGNAKRDMGKPDKPDEKLKGKEVSRVADTISSLPPEDLKNVALLMLLCICLCGVWTDDVDLLQGVPVGLAFGSIPFLLKAKLSYGQVGIFSLASYPYSMKLLWSPIVDAIYSKQLGRRKSWIVPIQFCSGLLLLWLGSHVESLIVHVLFPLRMC